MPLLWRDGLPAPPLPNQGSRGESEVVFIFKSDVRQVLIWGTEGVSVVVDPSSARGIQDCNQCVRMKGSMYVRTVVEGEDTSDICVDTDSRLTAGDIPGL